MSPEKSGKTSETHDIDEATQQYTLKEENNFGTQNSTGDDLSHDHDLSENTLITAVQKLIQLGGLTFSIGAIRDLGDLKGSNFEFDAALSVLSNLGYKSSFGKIKIKKLKSSHCPCIAFDKNGDALVIEDISENGDVKVNYFSELVQNEDITLRNLGKYINGYFIIAKKVPSLKKGKNDWFWGSLSKSKFLYFQVIIAATLTNFLGLSSSIFIMVVYDRVVPNEAIESLIALTIGVLIAMSFEFIIKTLRAQFVDRASKKADQRMSRLIFDKILNMRLDTGSKKSGALASVVREFDTLREFFTSATLIAVVDLPFVFFFIYIISLIAGPLALVPLIAVPLVVLSGLIV